MDNIRSRVLATILFLGTSARAMEEQPTTSPEEGVTVTQLMSVRQLLGTACQQTTPLNKEQLTIFAHAIDETEEFALLKNELHPLKIKMSTKKIEEDLEDADGIFSAQYKEAWAPRTAAAAAACGILTALKPYACGLLDTIPSETATIALAFFWSAEVKERKTQRISINNGSLVSTLVKTKTVELTKAKIKTITALQKLKKQAQEADVLSGQTTTPEIEEKKKDK